MKNRYFLGSVWPGEVCRNETESLAGNAWPGGDNFLSAVHDRDEPELGGRIVERLAVVRYSSSVVAVSIL